MAFLEVIDGAGVVRYTKVTGSGTTGDPYVPSVIVDSGGGGGAADTELPAAAALADGASNPTTPLIGACLLVWNGATFDRLRIANIHKDLSALSITSITTGWTPASGKKVILMGGSFSVSAACSVLFEDNSAGTTVWRTPALLAATPYSFDAGQGVTLAAANNVLKLTASAAATITGTLYGIEI